MFSVHYQGEAWCKEPCLFPRYSGNNTVFWIQYHLCLAHLSQVTHTMTMILPLLVEMIYPNHTYLWKHNACHRGDLSLFSLDKADLNLDFQESTGTFKLNSKRWPLKSLSRHSLESSVGIITSFLLFAFQFLMCWLGKKIILSFKEWSYISTRRENKGLRKDDFLL